MNTRQAKKILDGHDWLGDWDYEIWNKDQVRRARTRMSRHRRRTFHRSMAIVDLLNPNPAGAIQLWLKLRVDIAKRVISCEYHESESDLYAWGNKVYAGRRSSDLLSDVSYYSDRWCIWRIAVIDRGIESLARELGLDAVTLTPESAGIPDVECTSTYDRKYHPSYDAWLVEPNRIVLFEGHLLNGQTVARGGRFIEVLHRDGVTTSVKEIEAPSPQPAQPLQPAFADYRIDEQYQRAGARLWLRGDDEITISAEHFLPLRLEPVKEPS